MSGKDTVLLAIGGGRENGPVIDEIFEWAGKRDDPRIIVMTVASNETEGKRAAYNALFRKRGIDHVSVVNVSSRPDAYAGRAVEKLKDADVIYFTGGDQLNVTSLLGGSPICDAMHERIKDGVLIAGTSAGAAMMSSSMIIGGRSDNAPEKGGVELAPGLDLIPGTIIDSHFSQRGRHGRLLTAIAHHPQIIGIGIDEKTAIKVQSRFFEVVGEGTVTVIDGSKMSHSDLVYRKEGEPVGLFGAIIHVLPAGYSYDIENREPSDKPLTTKTLSQASG